MGLTLYIIFGYLATGYLIALITAAVAPPSVEPERVDVLTLVVVFCWGLIAIALVWRILCLPILLLRRARLTIAGRVSNEQ